MSKKFFYLFVSSMGTICVFVTPDLAQSSYCARLEDKCRKKCEKEKINFIGEIERRCAIEEGEIERKIDEKEILCDLNRVDDLLDECYKLCDDARERCDEENPTSGLEDEIESLRRQTQNLRWQLNRQEEWQRRKEGQELNKPPLLQEE